MGGNLFFFFFAFPKSVYITFNEANFLLLIIAATTTTIIIIKHQTSTIPLQKKKSTIFLIFTFFGHYLALRSYIPNKQTNKPYYHTCATKSSSSKWDNNQQRQLRKTYRDHDHTNIFFNKRRRI